MTVAYTLANNCSTTVLLYANDYVFIYGPLAPEIMISYLLYYLIEAIWALMNINNIMYA